MSLSVDIDPTRPYGGMTKLPEGTHGHFPERIPIREIYERDDGTFTSPILLTKTQLIEQIGPELYNKDVLWFLWDVRRFPCAQKFAAISTLTTIMSSLLQYYAFPKIPIRTVLRRGIALGAVSGLGSLGHCLWAHMQMWNEDFLLRTKYRDRRSYSIPETIQRSRDMENYEAAHKAEIEALQQQMAVDVKLASEEAKIDMRRRAGMNVIEKFQKDGV